MAARNITGRTYRRLSEDVIGGSRRRIADVEAEIAAMESALAERREFLESLREEASVVEDAITPFLAEYERVHGGGAGGGGAR